MQAIYHLVCNTLEAVNLTISNFVTNTLTAVSASITTVDAGVVNCNTLAATTEVVSPQGTITTFNSTTTNASTVAAYTSRNAISWNRRGFNDTTDVAILPSYTAYAGIPNFTVVPGSTLNYTITSADILRGGVVWADNVGSQVLTLPLFTSIASAWASAGYASNAVTGDNQRFTFKIVVYRGFSANPLRVDAGGEPYIIPAGLTNPNQWLSRSETFTIQFVFAGTTGGPQTWSILL